MPFKKGQSGNPAGRAPGTKSRDKIVQAAIAAVHAEAEAELVKRFEGSPAAFMEEVYRNGMVPIDIRLAAANSLLRHCPNHGEVSSLSADERRARIRQLLEAGGFNQPALTFDSTAAEITDAAPQQNGIADTPSVAERIETQPNCREINPSADKAKSETHNEIPRLTPAEQYELVQRMLSEGAALVDIADRVGVSLSDILVIAQCR